MEALIDFLICQLVRTPSFYHLTQRQTKDCFAETLRETVAKIEQGNRSAVQKNRTPELATLANTLFPLKVEVDQKNNFIKASTALGRHGFLSAALNFLEGEVAQLLRNSNWTILRSSRFFLTSDNPVVIMQRRGMTTTVGFEGGLVSFLTYVYLPLTPNHLLVTRIGSTREEANSMTLSPGLFDLFQKGSIYNARRYIYAKQKDDLVSKLRPQNVDQLAFENLEYEKSTWHSSQIELEKEFFQNSNEGQQSS